MARPTQAAQAARVEPVRGPMAARPTPTPPAAQAPKTAPAVPVAPAGWASGLVAVDGDLGAMKAAAVARGRALDVVRLRIDGDAPTALTAAAPTWKAAADTGAQLVIEAPLTLGGADLTGVGSGADTTAWAQLATNLRGTTTKPPIIRLTAPDGTEPAAVRPALLRVATVVRAAAPGTLIEWAAPLGTSPQDLPPDWPGDAVDLIGVTVPADKAWPALVTGAGGLTDWSDWAAAKGKRLAVTWSINRSTSAWQVTSVRAWLDVTAKSKRLAMETAAIAPDADPGAVAAYNASW